MNDVGRSPTDGTTARPNEWLDGVVLRAKDAGDGWMHVPVSDWHGVIDCFRMGERLYAEAKAQRDEARRWGRVHVKRAEDAEREWREAVAQRDEARLVPGQAAAREGEQ